MTFCGNCGATVTQQTGFCGSCGKPLGTANPPGAPALQTNAGGTVVASSSGLTSNVAGALAYALGLITGIIFLVIEPYKRDRFVRFHAMQSVIYSLACIVFSIAWSVMVGIIAEFSAWIALATFPIRVLISLGFFALWIYVIFQAYNNREYHIPFIGNLAAKQVG